MKKLAYETDKAGYTTKRGRTARKDRRVTLRPAPDTMAVLSALLPVEQGVACLAALRTYADRRWPPAMGAAGTRSWPTPSSNASPGRPAPRTWMSRWGSCSRSTPCSTPRAPPPVTSSGTARCRPGSWPTCCAHTEGKRWWRRLFSHPENGTLVGGESRARLFDGFLAQLIELRDGGRCRDAFCDAPIRHHDHIKQSRAGGPTSFTNGRGVCARGNYVREMPGWQVEVLEDGLGDQPHTVRTTTPTGHTYTSRAGP